MLGCSSTQSTSAFSGGARYNPPRPPPWPQTPDPCSRTTNAGAQARCDDDAKNAKSRAWNTRPGREQRSVPAAVSGGRRLFQLAQNAFLKRLGILARTSAAGQITQALNPLGDYRSCQRLICTVFRAFVASIGTVTCGHAGISVAVVVT